MPGHKKCWCLYNKFLNKLRNVMSPNAPRTGNMSKMAELFGRQDFGCMPVSFILPAEREQLKETMDRDR